MFGKLFGMGMVGAVILYPLGAYLKKAPLELRLQKQPQLPGWFMFLAFLQFPLFAFLALIGLPQSGLVEENFFKYSPMSMLLLVVLLPAIVCGITFSGLSGKSAAYPSWRLKNATEIMGNIFLIFSVMMITAIWNQTFARTFEGAAHGSWAKTLLWLICSIPPFALFYLSPRVLFLAEDYKSTQSWIGIFLVVLSLVWGMMA